MASEQAGIYFEKRKAGPAYLNLPSDKRAGLRIFLQTQLDSLAKPGTPRKEKKVLGKHKFEWAPGYVVHWRVVLGPREAVGSVTRISAYRIEVLHIEVP
jgi:hypothetical protein